MTATLEAPAAAPGLGQHLPVADLVPSKTNQRNLATDDRMEELVTSVREHGVLEPILVRPIVSSKRPRFADSDTAERKFEVIAGHRRFEAAKRAGLETIPAIVRELDDKAALEIQLIENVQRSDITALGEAEGYRLLMTKHGYTAERLAERIGKSPKYVYDRVKLVTGLVDEAKRHLENGHITAGHAILLARLEPKRQLEAIAKALFEHEDLLWNPDAGETRYQHRGDKKNAHPGKAVSVRELEGWIDEHVRFAPKGPDQVDPMLFPETQAVLKRAVEEEAKVVHITHDQFVQDSARDDKTRTIGPKSWKRADGEKGSKKCELAVIGVIVVGPCRGQAFPVCIAKEKCRVHWGKEIAERERNRRSTAKGKSSPQAHANAQQQRYKREQEKREAERKIFDGVMPKVAVELADNMRRAPFSKVRDRVLAELPDVREMNDLEVEVESLMPPGQTADDLVRHVAFVYLLKRADFWNRGNLEKQFKAFGVDLAKRLAAARAEAARLAKMSTQDRAQVHGYSAELKSKVLAAARKEGLTAKAVQERFGVLPVAFNEWRKQEQAAAKPGKKGGRK